MRIVAGLAKGRKIESPKGMDVRPTTDRVREALFSSIAFCLRDARVLDLFAGTGALGLEALSRGAKSAVFVDRDRRSIDLIKHNIDLCRFADRSTVIILDAAKAVRKLGAEARQFDLIFLDPPYQGPMLEQSLSALKAEGLLAPGGLIAAEHPSGRPPVLPVGLSIATTKRYGKTVLSFVRHTLDTGDTEPL
jgi:16S rRNA (guanine(966)-N(2))-methyltransferase RsmD